MFASRTKKTIDIDGVSVTIRKLSANSLENASEARQGKSVQMAKAFGPEMFRVLREQTPELETALDNVAAEKMSPDARARARYALYDRATVLRAGIESWNATDDRGKDVPVSTGVDDLDEDASRTLHEAILDLSLGPLDEDEAAALEGKL